jgi:hypothetical protein
MDHEELSQGDPDRRPGRPGGLMLGVAVLSSLLIGYLALGHHGTRASPTPTPTPTATATPTPWPIQTVRPGALEYLDIGTVCLVHLEGRRTLSVSFELVNPSWTAVRVLSVQPVPAGGQRQARATTAGGSCATPGREPAVGSIDSGRSRTFTIAVRLPEKCPQRLPVRVGYRIEVGGQELRARVGVFSNLGSVDFAGCPARSRETLG